MAASDKATDETPASPLDGAASSESAETLQDAAYTFRVKTLDQVCAEHIASALEIYRWNLSQAAPALGIDRRTLYRMCQRWGIARPERHPKARREPATLIPSVAEQAAFDGLEACQSVLTRAVNEGLMVPGATFSVNAEPPPDLMPGPGLGDLLRDFGPDDAETTRAVLRVGEYRYEVTDLVMTTAAGAPIREQFGALDLPGLPGLPELPKAPIAVSADSLVEFEEFSHIPTLEIDE